MAPNGHIGVGGVDSYDLDATVDGRGSKGALHLYNKFNMDAPANMFVVEYASRPDLASIFYEDVLMCSFFYGYPLLVENNKYGIVRYFESRGTKFDLTISSGLALLGAQKAKKEKVVSNFTDKKFFRTHKPKAWHF